MRILNRSNTIRLFFVSIGAILVTIASVQFFSHLKTKVLIPEIYEKRHTDLLSSQRVLDSIREDTSALPRLTIQDIFDNTFQKTETSTEFLFVGDTGLVRSINAKTVSLGDFRWPFIHVADLLKHADLAVVNLEGPLVPNCPVVDEGMVFCGSPDNVKGLLFAGIDIANIANNHIGDYGEAGYKFTVDLLKQNTILPYGNTKEGRPEIALFEKGGTTYAFIGFNQIYPDKPYIAKANDEIIRRAVSEAAQKSDCVIVSFHWGIEYTHDPSREMVQLAHAAVDSGADLVIGHHPHWIQPVEIYQGTPILYSLGNFVFDQMWSQKTREGLIARVLFSNSVVYDIMLIPVIIEDYGQPRIANERDASRILSHISNISANLSL